MYLVNFFNLQAAQQLFVAAARFRTGQQLLGAKNGANVAFTVPVGDQFTHNLPFFSIQVYYNGQRLILLDDYTVVESGGFGTGFDTVVLEVAPASFDKLYVDYIATGAP